MTKSNIELLKEFMGCFARSVKKHEDDFYKLFFRTDKEALELEEHGRMEELRKHFEKFYRSLFLEHMMNLAKTNEKAKIALTALESL